MKIPELLARYKLASRTTLYSRLKALNLEFAKDEDDKAFATKEQVAMLDDLDRHLEHGGRLSNYSPAHDVQVVSVSPANSSVNSSVNNVQSTELYSGLSSEQKTSAELLEKLVGAIATSIQPVNPIIRRHENIQQAMDNNWLLTSRDVEAISGRKPSRKGGDSCQIGGWRFISVGKSGNQLLWRVEKVEF